MTILLDTCALIWALDAPERLSAPVRELVAATETNVLCSQISLLEFEIKTALGKMRSSMTTRELVLAIDQAGFFLMPLRNETIFRLSTLPPIHRDPFDRLLICEALESQVSFCTPDSTIRRYPVETLW